MMRIEAEGRQVLRPTYTRYWSMGEKRKVGRS